MEGGVGRDDRVSGAAAWPGQHLHRPKEGSMSPRWATVAGYALYFYAAERHRRPHVDVRQGAEHATVDVLTGEILAGELPPAVLRAVQELLEKYRGQAVRAFNETLEHRFPGPLDQTEEGDK
jgi:hypothetical protein